MDYNEILKRAVTLLDDLPVEEGLLRICKLLNENVNRFTWVGFYFMDHKNRTLKLGPFVGNSTEHTTIPFGHGICGQVAESGKTYLAEDVSSEGNYIACSMDVRSEIVVPVFVRSNLIAQLDIDSNEINAFDWRDCEFLEELCHMIGRNMTGLESYASTLIDHSG